MNHSNLSAFGSIDPVYDSTGDRIRWFCTWYVDVPGEMARALDTLTAKERERKPSRITARLVSRGALSGEATALLLSRGFVIEARMVVDETLIISYVAKNSPQRQSHPQDACSEQALLRDIMIKPRKGAEAIRQLFSARGEFLIEMVNQETLSRSDIARLVELHHIAFPEFPYEFEHKLALMLAEPHTYALCQARSLRSGEIYAFSNLEITTVELNHHKTLRLAEYDNSFRATTSGDHAELGGLGSALRLQLAREAYRREVDLCHAESRASLVPINNISYHLGMCFGGALQQHLLISGQRSIDYVSPSPYESMNVWYLNRTHLAALL